MDATAFHSVLLLLLLLIIIIIIIIYVKKTVQFIETLCKGDIVVSDIKQQRSIFHHYKISNFSVIHSQKNPNV